MMTARLRSSAPNNPRQALARDQRLARRLAPIVEAAYMEERRAVLRDPADPLSGLDPIRWMNAYGELWGKVGEAVYQPALTAYIGEPEERAYKPPTKKEVALAKQQVKAVVDQIIGEGKGTAITEFVEDAANGVVKRSTKRIDRLLRQVDRPSDLREVSRGLRRLYKTSAVKDEAFRDALNQVLRSTATFEHTAALRAQEVTGREYEKHWRHQPDDKVRDSHLGVEPVALGELFKVGGGMRFPRDPAGPASETYGCRCWTERRRL